MPWVDFLDETMLLREAAVKSAYVERCDVRSKCEARGIEASYHHRLRRVAQEDG